MFTYTAFYSLQFLGQGGCRSVSECYPGSERNHLSAAADREPPPPPAAAPVGPVLSAAAATPTDSTGPTGAAAGGGGGSLSAALAGTDEKGGKGQQQQQGKWRDTSTGKIVTSSACSSIDTGLQVVIQVGALSVFSENKAC